MADIPTQAQLGQKITGDSPPAIAEPMKKLLVHRRNQQNESLMSNEQQPEYKTLRLDQFLKLCGIAGTGGQAKLLIQGGEVLVNGELETRRRRKLAESDVVQFDGSSYLVNEFVPDF